MSTPDPPASRARPAGRLVGAQLLQTLVMLLVIGGVLFLSAGRLAWPAAWAFLIVYFLIALVTARRKTSEVSKPRRSRCAMPPSAARR